MWGIKPKVIIILALKASFCAVLADWSSSSANKQGETTFFRRILYLIVGDQVNPEGQYWYIGKKLSRVPKKTKLGLH